MQKAKKSRQHLLEILEKFSTKRAINQRVALISKDAVVTWQLYYGGDDKSETVIA